MRNLPILLSLFVISLLTASLITILRPEAQFVRTDMIAYHAASQIFFQGGDPYSSNQVLEVQRSIGLTASSPLLIWNPPIIFVVFGQLLKLAPVPLTLIWQALAICSGFFMLLLGVVVASADKGTGLYLKNCGTLKSLIFFVLTLFLAFPFIVEIYLFQIALVLGAAIAGGVLLFFDKKYFLSGLVLSVVLIKPHLAFLPIALLGFWVLKDRRFSFLVGMAVGLISTFLLAEWINPGITHKWLYRNEWPYDLLGSSTISFFTALFQSYGLGFSLLMKLILLVASVGLFVAWRRRKLLQPTAQELLVAALFSPMITPYGYVFDQTILIPVVGYYAATAFQKSESSGIKAVVLLGVVTIITFITFSCEGFAPFAVPLAWYVYPPLIVAVCLLTDERQDAARPVLI